MLNTSLTGLCSVCGKPIDFDENMPDECKQYCCNPCCPYARQVPCPHEEKNNKVRREPIYHCDNCAKSMIDSIYKIALGDGEQILNFCGEKCLKDYNQKNNLYEMLEYKESSGLSYFTYHSFYCPKCDQRYDFAIFSLQEMNFPKCRVCLGEVYPDIAWGMGILFAKRAQEVEKHFESKTKKKS